MAFETILIFLGFIGVMIYTVYGFIISAVIIMTYCDGASLKFKVPRNRILFICAVSIIFLPPALIFWSIYFTITFVADNIIK